MKHETRALCILGILATIVGSAAASAGETREAARSPYASFGRFTDPAERSSMLEPIPEEPMAIAAVAAQLTVHHNLLAHFGIPQERWPEVRSVWPPRAPDILDALADSGPGDLVGERPVSERVRGACMLESHLLASMLRYRRIPVRLRAGYFRDVYANEDHLVAFWENNARAKGVAAQLLEEDPERWREVNHEHTRRQVAVNKLVEHWVAEYWDEAQGRWRRLDANRTFLKAMSGIEVGFELPRRHFEYAHESWRKMRTAAPFDPDQYAEWPQDGRSHIRSQLLWDFYSLLNHDIAGYDKTAWPADDESSSRERDAYAFVKERAYDELSAQELRELDALADLLSRDPDVEELIAFYREHETVRLETVEADRYSFVARPANPR